MFNRFKKKEPEKKQSDFVGAQHEHGQVIILFDTSLEKNFKYANYKYHVAEGKEKTRLHSMVDTASNIGGELTSYYQSALSIVSAAKTPEEALARQLGLAGPISIQGMSICPACLQKAIMYCEESLTVLHDLQDVIKRYT